MFNNFAKFELPAIRGEELWPDQIQSPLIVRASLEYAPNDRDPPHADILTGHFHEIVDNNTPRILNFLMTQRRNYQIGSVDFASTLRTIDELTVHYTNIQGKHEILQLNGRLTPEVYAELQERRLEQPEFRKEKFEEPERPEYPKKAEEEEKDQLCVLVFHGGNRISYAPMTGLKNFTGTGTATRRRLRSDWGTDLVKTCQMQFASKYSVIFSGLAGVGSKDYISRGDSFTLYSSKLTSSRSSDVLTLFEYPIMNGTGNTVHLPTATATFNDQGIIQGYSPVLYYSKFIPSAPQSLRYSPFAISANGERYLAYGFYGPYSPAFSIQSMILSDNCNGEMTGAGSLGDYPPPAGTKRCDVSPYMLGYGDYDYLFSTYQAYRPQVYRRNDTYLYDYEYEIIPNPETPTFPGSRTWATLDMPFQRVSSSGQSTIGTIYTYSLMTHEVSSNATDIWSKDGADWGSISQYNDLYLPGADFAVVPGMLRPLWIIPWPPSSSGIPWYVIARVDWKIWNAALRSDAYEFTLVTPYGIATVDLVDNGMWVGQQLASGLTNTYRSWLHIANSEYMLQGFEVNGNRRMYLNNVQLTSLLGVAVNQIQTVLFDIPLKKIEQFK